jgi:hypothetical protein
MEAKQRNAVLQLIREAMPKVRGIVADKRKEHGDAFVTLCQQRGLAGEPGWFYAREGMLTVGTPWATTREIEAEYERMFGTYAGAALVVLGEKGALLDGPH